MSSLTKLAIQEPSLLDSCKLVLDSARCDAEPEMQQRAIEYQTFLVKYGDGSFKDDIEDIFDAMPTQNNDIAEKNVLLSVLNRSEKFTSKTVIGLNDNNTYVEGKINGDNGGDMKNYNIGSNVGSNVTNNNSGNLEAKEVNKEKNLLDF